MPDTAFELPLFPLPTVLFPGISMELNVRYPGQHAMLKEAVDRGSRLGIVLPKNVVPADDPVPWHSVGTLSSVADVRPSRGPRVFFSVLGEARFRVLEVLQRDPYPRATVEPITEPAGEVAAGLVEQVRDAFFAYLDARSALTGGWLHELTRRSESAALSYLVARYMEAVPAVKQTLLEIPGHADRLERELTLLAQETELLRQMPRPRRFPGLPSLN